MSGGDGGAKETISRQGVHLPETIRRSAFLFSIFSIRLNPASVVRNRRNEDFGELVHAPNIYDLLTMLFPCPKTILNEV